MSIWSGIFRKRKQGRERFILSIDGGGMRGIVPLAVLRRFEKLLQEKGFKGNLASAFDLVSGTSTGGLIALCSTCSDKPDLDVLQEQYLTLGKTIFPASGKRVSQIRQISSDKYPVNGIEEVITQWFGEKKLSCASTKTLIMAYDLSEGKEAVFKSWDENPVSVFTAARATSAAPTYFAPLISGNHIYVDGGIIANNPAVYALNEARKLWPDCSKFTIISLSTAGASHKMTKDQFGGILSWVSHISPMYMTAQKRTCDNILENYPGVEYIRIDNQMDQDIKMDETDPSVLEALRDKGEEIFRDNEQLFESLAEKLVSVKKDF